MNAHSAVSVRILLIVASGQIDRQRVLEFKASRYSVSSCLRLHRQRNAPKNLSRSATAFADCHDVWHFQCQARLIVSELIGIRQLKSEFSFHIFRCTPIKSGPESLRTRTFSPGPPPIGSQRSSGAMYRPQSSRQHPMPGLSGALSTDPQWRRPSETLAPGSSWWDEKKSSGENKSPLTQRGWVRPSAVGRD